MRYIAQMLSCALLLGCGGGGHAGPVAGSSGNDMPHAGSGGAQAGTGSAAGSGGASGTRVTVSGGSGGVHDGPHGGDSAKAGASGTDHIDLPHVYPPVRANTPTSLIADPTFAPPVEMLTFGNIEGLPQGLGGPINLAQAIQDRLYTAGPTEILRIVQALDDRTSGLDTTPSRHACLTSAPTTRTISLPGGQLFAVQLQCIDQYVGGWMAFGFDEAQDEDAGPVAVHGGSDFYLVEGQDGGMGGAYRIDGTSGDVEGWITVADSRAPNNSQVIMHLLTNTAAGTTELALAGSGVGFCSAHLKTGHDLLFIEAKTNGAPPPGTPMTPAMQYCDDTRSGCFNTSALDTDLGAAAPDCAPIATSSFGISHDIDASSDAGANVVPATIYTYFNLAPTGIAAF